MVCTELCGFGHSTMRALRGGRAAGRLRRLARGPAAEGRRRRPEPAGDDAGGAAAERQAVTMIGFDGGSEVAAALKRPGLVRGRARLLIGAGVRLRPGRRPARDLAGCAIFQTEQTGYPQVIVPAITGAARLPGRASAPSTTGSAGRSAPRPPRRTTRQHGAYSLARLLQVQHRSQGDRDPVHLHDLLLLLHRRR